MKAASRRILFISLEVVALIAAAIVFASLRRVPCAGACERLAAAVEAGPGNIALTVLFPDAWNSACFAEPGDVLPFGLVVGAEEWVIWRGDLSPTASPSSDIAASLYWVDRFPLELFTLWPADARCFDRDAVLGWDSDGEVPRIIVRSGEKIAP